MKWMTNEMNDFKLDININMSSWLNWIERLTSNQEVAGSSPAVDFKIRLYI